MRPREECGADDQDVGTVLGAFARPYELKSLILLILKAGVLGLIYANRPHA